MDDLTNQIDELLEKGCYIIDYLPEMVEKDSCGQFFDVEYYFLNSRRYTEVANRFSAVILKLMCYYHTVALWNGWVDRPAPALIDEAVREIMENHSGTLEVLFPEEDALLVFDWDCLNLSVYNPPERMQGLMEKIAVSEGLFWRSAAES